MSTEVRCGMIWNFEQMIFGPPGIKMTFEKNLLRHQLALFLGFNFSFEHFFMGPQLTKLGSIIWVFKK